VIDVYHFHVNNERADMPSSQSSQSPSALRSSQSSDAETSQPQTLPDPSFSDDPSTPWSRYPHEKDLFKYELGLTKECFASHRPWQKDVLRASIAKVVSAYADALSLGNTPSRAAQRIAASEVESSRDDVDTLKAENKTFSSALNSCRETAGELNRHIMFLSMLPSEVLTSTEDVGWPNEVQPSLQGVSDYFAGVRDAAKEGGASPIMITGCERIIKSLDELAAEDTKITGVEESVIRSLCFNRVKGEMCDCASCRSAADQQA
jgi:hypothetical protein